MRYSALIAVAALWLCAAAPASYDAVCTGPCTASDGTVQAAGTALYRFLWDGLAPFTPRDATGGVLNAVADPAQTAVLYQPSIITTVTAATDPILSLTQGATAGHLSAKHASGAIDDVVPTLSGDASGTTAATVIMGLRGSFRNLAIANLVPLNTIGDHAVFAMTPVLAPYVLKEVDAANCVSTPTLAQISIWTGPGATGTRLVAPTLLSSIPLLTGAGQAIVASSINSPRQSGLTLYLHVDVANLAADTCSFYLQGISALDATQLATTVNGS